MRANTVIAGFGGELIPQMFAEHALLADPPDGTAASFERALARWWRRVSGTLGPASGVRAIADVAVTPLLEMLGYERPVFIASTRGIFASQAACHCVWLVVPWTMPTAAAGREVTRLALQQHADWAVAINGHSMRIIDVSRPWNRAAIAFDFAPLVEGRKGVLVLWRLAHGSRLSSIDGASLRGRIAAADAHAARVCRSLSDAVLEQLPRLAGALAPRSPTRDRQRAALDQALTLVYRILFLLFAEARGLVPTWHQVYRDAYMIGSLAERAARSGDARGLWQALQAISRLAHTGCSAGDLQVTAFNGRLFAPRHTPLINQQAVPDRIARDLLLALATETTSAGRRFISYHDLGVEQLGSVYERVLDHEPSGQAKAFTLERTSTERKTSGSFYTPRSLTDFLVRRTLEPLVAGRNAEQILALRVLDPAMGSGAFLVAACRYLADCCERAYVDEGQWRQGDVSDRDRAGVRRMIAERCLYGVDLNPTAVQLARLSLWLTTLAAERPLTFLDHHLTTGNSVIGARVVDLARPPRLARSRSAGAQLQLFDDQLIDVMAATVLPARWQLAWDPSDSVEAVRRKEHLLADLNADEGPLASWRRAADAWCGAALCRESAPSSGLVQDWIAGELSAPTMLPSARLRQSSALAQAQARGHGAFHWELAFPEVFFDASGHPGPDAGFDAVIGNPPWEMMRADSGSADERDASRAQTAAAVLFCRRSGVFSHVLTGHPNRYQLFLERALQLSRPGGRIGLLLPSGIANDRGSAALRRRLLDRTSIDTWIGFENRRRIFPIHRSVRFVVLTTTVAGQTDRLKMQCGLTDPETLHRPELESAPLTIARSRIEAWSPDQVIIPDITSATALGILTGIADRIPALGDAAGWHARFGRELNATDDRPHFQAFGARRRALLPIVEGKQLSPFQIDLAKSQRGIPRAAASGLLDEAATFSRSRIGYRDVASATNKLTLIAALLPEGVVSTHTVFCLKSRFDEQSQWCLLALLNSLVANYLVRLHVTTHVSAGLLTRIPVPRPASTSPEFTRLGALAKRLSQSGIDDGVDDYAELNALAARLYGVTNDQFTHIVDTFPLLLQSLRERCLAEYKRATETLSH